MSKLTVLLAATLAASVCASAQSFPRRATITGGGGGGGKCTIEVVVDGAADVEIRGDQAVLRNLQGRAPEWRRFQCNMVMPTNPMNFRFQGIDGRGLQVLSRSPQGGGPAVVHIEDKDNGSEGYTFDLIWGGAPIVSPGPMGGGMRDGDRDRMPSRRFTTEQAVRVCQDSVRAQALDRFRGRAVEFRDTRLDDQPGRNDWVVGTIDVLRGREAEGPFRFSCSVNFDTGQVRSAQIDANRFMPDRRDQDRAPEGDRLNESCRRAVMSRLRTEGYDRVEMEFTRRVDNPGRDLRLNGIARADRGPGREEFSFSCTVDPRDGGIRSVDVVLR